MTTRSTYPNLANAPIEEAIISLTIGQEKHDSLEKVEAICKDLECDYPQRKDWRVKEIFFEEHETGSNMSQRDNMAGFAISSEDEKKFLHLNRDTLSLNRLKPYGSWEDFAADYKTAWDVFTESLKVKKIERLVIRYINKFAIPMKNWEDYLLMHPGLAGQSEYDDSMISMGEVFARYFLGSERHAAQSVVLLDIRPGESDLLQVIMDIEVTSRIQIDNYSGYHDVIDALNRLRDFKNQIFFSNIPKAKEIF